MASVVLTSGQRWELGEQIGKGGAGQVYAATCGASGPHVIKLVPSKDEDTGVEREAFIGVGLINQPNVLPVLDTGKTNTHLALLMRRAEKSLRGPMDQARGPVPGTDALPILIDIARGLVSLSRAQVPFEDAPGVVHRDLKPENVLLLDGSWYISDFGIARVLNRGTSYDTRRYFMTHEYAAPEQWRGETATSATDVYAFGIIAFEILMGFRPFGAGNLRRQHLGSELPPMDGVPPALAAIVTECLFKLPGARPSADRLLNRLEAEPRHNDSVRNGISALRSISSSEAEKRAKAELRGQRRNEDNDRRNRLFVVACNQSRDMRRLLKDTILESNA